MVGCIIYTYQHGGNKMAKYEIRKWDYDNHADRHEYLGASESFNTFAEVKSFILNNKNAHMVVFGDVFKGDEFLFSAPLIFDYIKTAQIYRECGLKTKSLGLKSLLAYADDSLSIKI